MWKLLKCCNVCVVLGKLICYLDFENQPETGTSIKDKSENGNNGYRERGLLLVNFKGCGNAAYLYCGDILFHGDTFQAKPYSGKYFMITACLSHLGFGFELHPRLLILLCGKCLPSLCRYLWVVSGYTVSSHRQCWQSGWDCKHFTNPQKSFIANWSCRPVGFPINWECSTVHKWLLRQSWWRTA